MEIFPNLLWPPSPPQHVTPSSHLHWSYFLILFNLIQHHMRRHVIFFEMLVGCLIWGWWNFHYEKFSFLTKHREHNGNVFIVRIKSWVWTGLYQIVLHFHRSQLNPPTLIPKFHAKISFLTRVYNFKCRALLNLIDPMIHVHWLKWKIYKVTSADSLFRFIKYAWTSEYKPV